MGIIDDLKKDRTRDQSTLNKLVVELYKNALNIIKMKNKLGSTDLVYEIPNIYIGFPVFDQEEVALKMTVFFKKKGFKAIFKSPNKIYIKW